MAKKYQVFVSSTYSDLVEERQSVSRAILDMGHIPAGMEMFPAADVEQLAYIKKVIDECDYYVIIVGARYGSADDSGTSYTEHEYNYAVQTGKTVLAFIHRNMDNIVLGKTDKDETKRKKLEQFIVLLKKGRLVQFWDSSLELRANAIVSLTTAFSQSPQTGWVRADTVANETAMSDIVKYRAENDALRTKIANLTASIVPQYTDAAGLDESREVNYTYFSGTQKRTGSRTLTYKDLLTYMAHQLHTASTAYGAQTALLLALKERLKISHDRMSLVSSEIQDILLHFVATKHVTMWAAETKDGTQNVTGYKLTPLGIKFWQEATYVRSSN